MKRLKIPRITARIPLPALPGVHRSSQDAKDKPDIPVVTPPPADEKAPDVKSADQLAEVEKKEHSRVNVPRIPLPGISKPRVPKLHALRIPLRGMSRPGVAKPGIPKTDAAGTAAPDIPEQTALPAGAEPAEVDKNAMPAAPVSGSPAALDHPTEKGKTRISARRITLPKMPSLRRPTQPAPSAEITSAPQTADTRSAAAPDKAKSKSKVGMPKLPKISKTGMSKGKGSAKSAGRRILALSIEGNDIRVLSYSNNAIESWKSLSFEPRLLKMGHIADPEGFGEVIKNATTGIETNRCYVVCALPGLKSVSRIITIPNVGKKELDAVVPREVRRTMTVSEDDNYFHWQILPSETETATVRVFLLAVPKEPVTLLLRALSHARLNPSNIDLKPLALMRAINQKEAIIANCEGNSMELVIVTDDVPVLIRSVFLGEGVVNQDYAVGRISDELGRTIVTYNEINKERPLDQNTPIYLTGQAAAGVPFALNVAALTGRTVQPLESLIPLPADLPLSEYMVNIGLILKVI